MSANKKVFKVITIALAVFVGFTTVAFAAYYVYENRTELPILKNIFETEEGEDEAITEEATVAPTWIIEIRNGNIVKTQQNGKTTILIDKEDYDDIERFSDVATSPDYDYVCFLAHKFIPIWMYYAKTDGSEVTEAAVAENCVWSNDSEKIAYNNHTTDVSPHNVYMYYLSTKNSTNFTGDLSSDPITRIYDKPVWSDDDTTITSAFNSYDDNNNWALTSGTSVIDIETGEVTDTLD